MYDDSDIDGSECEETIHIKRKLGRPSASQHEYDDSYVEETASRQPRRKRILPIDMLLATICCTTMLCVASLCEADILRARESYQMMSNHEQKQWLLDFFCTHSIFNEKEINWKFIYIIRTKTVCCMAFQLILGIPSSTFYAIRKKLLNLDCADEEWPLDILTRATSVNDEIQNLDEDSPNSVYDFVDEDASIPPVLIGKQNKGNLSMQPIQVKDMVLLDLPKYAGEWPQLGQVVQLFENKIKIKWYKGSMSGMWTPCTIRVQGERGRREPWTEDVSPAQIWCWGFSLTPSGHLTKRIKEKVKDYDAY